MKSILKNKSTKTIITILFCIFTLFCLSTIVYSAISSTMNITGLANARVEADVRITDFSLYEVVNATSQYEEFSKNTISSRIAFQDNAYVTYKIKVTNYGETDIGIYSIDGLPDEITYELIDYNLKDKICNNSGKCNNYAEKEFYIKIIGNNTEVPITLSFNFRVFHNIKYTNFLNSYTEEALSGSNLVLDLSNEEIQFIEIKANEQVNYNYNYNNKTLTIHNIICDIEIIGINQAIYTFEYTDSYQTFTVPYDGIYKIELWGAQGGGTSSYPGGKGAYTAGELSLNEGETFHVFVGESGQTSTKIVFNSGWKTEYFYAGTYAGGGSTDIRLVSGHWSDFESLKSRIMVAAGGGGAITYHSQLPGGAAGGLTGYSGSVYCSYAPASGTTSTGGTQVQGGTNGLGDHIQEYTGNNINLFGNITYFYYSSNLNGAELSAGGNGYYAGGNGAHGTNTTGAAAGGSSFISGHNGCNAIANATTNYSMAHTHESLHYSGYIFSNTKMVDGQGYSWTNTKGSQTGMPTFDGTSTINGNTGNGYAKITLLEIEEKEENYIESTNYNASKSSNANIDASEIIILDKLKLKASINLKKEQSSVITYDIKVCNKTKDNLIYTGNSIIESTNTNIGIINNESKNPFIINENTCETIPFSFSYLDSSNITSQTSELTISLNFENTAKRFEYTGNYETFTAPYNGIYKIELWGAQGGGSSLYTGGKGGYTSGNIELSKDNKLYVYVGEYGGNNSHNIFNNGWISKFYISGYYFSGGGSTDIRLTSGSWYDFNSLTSRIMVAGAGGGGLTYHSLLKGGAAGGLIGYNGTKGGTGTTGTTATGGTQTSGGTNGLGNHLSIHTAKNLFGDITYRTSSKNGYELSGGGNGYYSGGNGGHGADTTGSAAGGSSFISGHEGCDAISSSSTSTAISHTGQSHHYSNYSFTDTKMVDGEGYSWTTQKSTYTGMPTQKGNATMIGNTGHGYAKITLIEFK